MVASEWRQFCMELTESMVPRVVEDLNVLISASSAVLEKTFQEKFFLGMFISLPQEMQIPANRSAHLSGICKNMMLYL